MSAGIEGRSLELYFIDGKPDGMLTAEVFNWTGHVLMAPRTRLSAMLARKEANYTGVYILIGEQDGEPLAYIGEGEDISYRIKNHDAKKEWWTQAVLVTSTANNLHKAHVKYLEARLIEEARNVKRVSLENGTTPSRPSLSESAQSNMEAFLAYLFMVLPALRVDVFVQNSRTTTVSLAKEAVESEPEFELIVNRHNIRATAVMRDDEFIVRKGSIARSNWEGQGSGQSTYARLHAELKKAGVLVDDGNICKFSQDYKFNSVSAAAAVVAGRPASGMIEWKLRGTGKSYKEWESDQLIAEVDDLDK